jgi:hypothetical protein
MKNPYYWIVNPVYTKYHSVNKKLLCVTCEFNINTETHNVHTILYDEKEKKRQFNIKKKKLLGT